MINSGKRFQMISITLQVSSSTGLSEDHPLLAYSVREEMPRSDGCAVSIMRCKSSAAVV
jgi:hypothetical protein